MERRDSTKENINPLKYIEDLKDFSVDSLAPEPTTTATVSPDAQATDINNETDLASESISLLNQSLGPALVATSSFELMPTPPVVAPAPLEPIPAQPMATQEPIQVSSGSTTVLGDVTNQQKPFADRNGDVAAVRSSNASDAFLSGDNAENNGQNGHIVGEAQEYADDLVRDLIVDEIEAPATADTTQQQWGLSALGCRLTKKSPTASKSQHSDDQEKIELIEEQEAEFGLVAKEKTAVVDELVIESELKDDQQQEEATAISDRRQSDVNSDASSDENSKLSNQSENYSPVAKFVTDNNIATANVFDAHQSFQTAAGNSLVDCDDKLSEMEFTKNYSDDLLMGRNDGSDQQGEIPSSGGDLADFELPPYSGSSSGSEQLPKQSSTERESSSVAAQQQASSSHHVSVAPPNLTAVKNLLLSSYSRVSHVFHWKKPIESGVFFAIGVTLITALTFFSIISVVAYTALGAILASSLIRVYKAIMKTLNRSQETPFDHIWDKILSINVSLSPEKVHELVDVSLGNMNASLVYFKQVLLVEDKFATIKFGLFLYLLTYIGSWFNGMTLITICYLALFSVPVFYEKNKAKIDECLNLVTGQLSTTVSMVTTKVSSLVFGSAPVPSTSGTKKQN